MASKLFRELVDFMKKEEKHTILLKSQFEIELTDSKLMYIKQS